MPEYLIFFNDEWVTETSDEGMAAAVTRRDGP